MADMGMNVPMPLCYYANGEGGEGEGADPGSVINDRGIESGQDGGGGSNGLDSSANTVNLSGDSSSANNDYEQHAGGDDAQHGDDEQQGVGYEGGYCFCALTVFADNFPVALNGVSEAANILIENRVLCFYTYNFARDVWVGLSPE